MSPGGTQMIADGEAYLPNHRKKIYKYFHPNGVTQKNMAITKAAEKTFLSSLHENFVIINYLYFLP